ncbi:ABC transporter substrate-binding protein [Marinitoga litoralis]|uniref:ABC transporter substrate-binding protein n=1 Tax=Marinitoga litoralis TaxID=570855 RepID=UPI0019612FF8|nr:sugar ABC transporter substrate-binding protein [Marinitoga litoralis]MBM7559358.1 multiple sugar transport system substrate-binding protein [Marinitoga litoralis]
MIKKHLLKKYLLLFFILFYSLMFGVNFLYMYQAGYQPEDLIKYINSQNVENIFVTFKFYEDMYENITVSVNSKEPFYDIALVDLIWIPELASNNMILPLDDLNDYFDNIPDYVLEQFKYNGKIYALPYLVNIQHFYVNNEILRKAGFDHPPKTLEEMVYQAKIIKEKGILEYPIVDSWVNEEVLMCEFTWLLGAFGGDYYQGNTIKINTKEAVKALSFMKKLLDEGLINPLSLEFKEDDILDVFINGDAAFTTNWTYQSRYMEDPRYSKILKKGSLELIPVSESIKDKKRTVSVSGFQGLAILKNTKNIEDSIQALKVLTRSEFFHQFDNEIPIYKNMHKEYEKEKEYNKKKLIELENVLNRPSLIEYNKFSEIVRRYITMALKGLLPPKEALDKAQKEIEKIMNNF